jgi:hypothetical protein
MTKLEAAERWLQNYLEANGTAPSSQIKADGLREGHSDRTLKRAAESMWLRITNTSTMPRQTLWSLRTTERTTERVTAPNPYI